MLVPDVFDDIAAYHPRCGQTRQRGGQAGMRRLAGPCGAMSLIFAPKFRYM